MAMSMPSSLQAQTTQPKDTTMTRTVVVEQEYNPDIMDASKVNVLPKVEEPTVSKKEVEYATTFFPATSVPRDMYVPDMVIMAIWIFLPIIYSVCRRKTN